MRLAELLAHSLCILPRGIDGSQRAVPPIMPHIPCRTAFHELLPQLLRGRFAFKSAQLQRLPCCGWQRDFPLLHGLVKVSVGGNRRGGSGRLNGQIPAA